MIAEKIMMAHGNFASLNTVARELLLTHLAWEVQRKRLIAHLGSGLLSVEQMCVAFNTVKQKLADDGRQSSIHHRCWREKLPWALRPPPQHQWCIKFLGPWEEDCYTTGAQVENSAVNFSKISVKISLPDDLRRDCTSVPLSQRLREKRFNYDVNNKIWELRSTCKYECGRSLVPTNISTNANRHEISGGLTSLSFAGYWCFQRGNKAGQAVLQEQRRDHP